MAEFFTNTASFLQGIFSVVATKLIVAVLILLIGIIIAKIVERFLLRILNEFGLNVLLKKSRLNIAGEELISSAVKFFIYFVTGIIALNQVGLTTFVLNMIAVALIVFIVVIILLGIKDFIPNLIGGISIYRKAFIKKGDKIKVNKISGIVSEISLTETRLKTRSGDIISVPNSVLVNSVVGKKR